MTQFKDKSQKHADNVNVGLFAYPSLMAADILAYQADMVPVGLDQMLLLVQAYQADMVPVGLDQKQHLELTRNIAERFNGIYGQTFKVPDPYIPKVGAKIMSLQDPTRKMSKSDENVNSYVALLDKPDDIMRKFKRAITDSDAQVRYGEGKDGINNLMGIYSVMTGKTNEEIEREFDGKGYGDFKLAVGEAVADELEPLQKRYDELMKDKSYIDQCIKTNDERAAYVAGKTLRKVHKKIGLTELIR